MLIGLEEVKNYAFTYIEKYRCGENLGFLFQYAPYILMTKDIANRDKFSSDIFSYNDTPHFKLMEDIAKLIRFVMPEQNIFKIKDFVCEYLKSMKYKKDCTESQIAKDFYINYLNHIRDRQYEDKLLENAIISYAPIQPYEGIIVKPDMTKTQRYEESNIDKVISILNRVVNNEAKIEDVLKKYIENYCFEILENHNKTLDPSEDIFSFIINKKDDYSESDIYYFLVALYYKSGNFTGNEDLYNTILKLLINIKTYTNGFPKIKLVVESLVDVMTEAVGIFNKSFEDFALESVNPEFLEDKKIGEILDETDSKQDEPDTLNSKYNLNILTSFLYTKLQYKHDKFTNSMFLSREKNIQGYSFLQNNILIYEMDDEHICSPVVDLADNFKMKIVCLDRNGQISVKNM